MSLRPFLHPQDIWDIEICDPMDCGPPGSTVRVFLQDRILE